jgi:hypothetical protein
MPADDFRNRRLLPHKPILSAFISGPRPDPMIPREALTPLAFPTGAVESALHPRR